MTGRDHGGGIDAAAARWGGARADWLDLSTGINPDPYPVGELPPDAWTALPDAGGLARLEAAARAFWAVPGGAQVVAAPGASALIAQMPHLPWGTCQVTIPGPTYNEHAAAFDAAGWTHGAGLTVTVRPNNPDGAVRDAPAPAIVDESFCDVTPDATLIARTARPGTVVLKSFGKFWGLAGLRLGFAIGHPETLAGLTDRLGPWAVSGPALAIGARALADRAWAEAARARLARDAARLDALTGLEVAGGTDLFRLYRAPDARAVAERLAARRILVRTFPYDATWLRLGLPPPDAWDRLSDAWS
ncbi:MAG: aminotransferase class I/II-fold pyridoxal phosphate-dependent enzyme [Paracoccaceae bacterium]